MPKKSVKKEEEKKTNVAKVTASYSRKLNLQSVSSRFDNIDQGLYVTALITYEDSEEFENKVATLANKVRESTEKEIVKSVSKLMDMSKDESNNALLGTGENLSIKAAVEEEFGSLEDLLAKDAEVNEVVSSLGELEEVDMGAL